MTVSNNAELYWLPSARLIQALRNVRVTIQRKALAKEQFCYQS